MAALITSIKQFVISSEKYLLWHLFHQPPPDAMAMALANVSLQPRVKKEFSFLESLKDPFLWAVPKHRRSIYRRRQRRFGSIDRFWKMIRQKTNLLVCTECGGYKEAGLLCPTCYERVKIETEAMQDKIQTELGLSPVEKEVVVLYDGEEIDKKSETWKGKRIVEMSKPRPPWFNKNLLQPSTQAPATTTAVEPKDLA